ncbi:MAG: hypothetical protein K2W95_09975 [Candidatus Obscuribacterales bacterium]|nr:hypothetical protein [Candidatus Obscuribacterales bacterium]
MSLSLTDLVLPAESITKTMVKEFGTAAAYSLLQSPLNSVAQIVDKSFGTEVLPSVQLIEPRQKAEFGSRNWHAQEVGNAVGMVLPFLLMHAGTRALGKKVGLDLCHNGALTTRRYGNEVLLAGSTGIAYGALLTPSDPKESLLFGRLKNATEQGATFATLAAVAGGMKLWGQTLENRVAARLLRNDIFAATLAGIPAGSVSADAHSVLAGKGLASRKEREQAMYGFMVIGGTLGLAHSFGDTRMSKRSTSLLDEVRATQADGRAQLEFALGESGRLGSTERPSPEPVYESREVRKAREAAEAQVKLTEFLERPNPTSLAESCRNVAERFRKYILDAETRRKEQNEFTEKRISQYDDVATKLEQFAQNCGPDTTIGDLNKLVDQLKTTNDAIARDLKEIIEAHSPAKLVVQEQWGGHQYRVFEDGTCLRTNGSKACYDGKSRQVVFVDAETARAIENLREDGKLAGRSFPATAEWKPETCPVQIGNAAYDSMPPAVIKDGTVTFPNENGCAGSVEVGRLLDPPAATPSLAEVAESMAKACRASSRESTSMGKSSAEYQTTQLEMYRRILDTVQQYPQRFPTDNPGQIFELPSLIKERNPGVEDYVIQPLIEEVYEHAPARLVFTTEKGSAYRLYGDGSLGRLKSNGFTRDRCENQYFTDPAEGQRLLDAANDEGLANFSLPVYLEPSPGLIPLSLHRAGHVPRTLPTFSEGRLLWPDGYRVSFDGHVGHQITNLRYLPPQLTPQLSGPR